MCCCCAGTPWVVIEPAGGAHTATVVFMHGLGDNAFGWSDAVKESFAPKLPHVKFIVPTATEMAVTINGGMEMPAWVGSGWLAALARVHVCTDALVCV